MARLRTRDILDEKKGGKYFELKKSKANGQEDDKDPVEPASRGVQVPDLDLKVEDSVSEAQQASDLIVLDEVKELPTTPTDRYQNQEDELVDLHAQGVGDSLNEQQGRTVLLTYSRSRRRRAPATAEGAHMGRTARAARKAKPLLDDLRTQTQSKGGSTPDRIQHVRRQDPIDGGNEVDEALTPAVKQDFSLGNDKQIKIG